jgi:phosphate transport system substrate-binding protein
VTGTFAVRVTFALSALALAAACSGGDNRTPAGGTTAAAGSVSGSVDLNGAGATFPQPIYSKWFSDYATRTGVKINYQSIGSGGGVRQISEQTVDFGASDAAMSDEDLAKAKGGPLMHFPTVLGAVVLTYNVPGITQPLKVSGQVISDIFLGKITKWNDARIASVNPGVTLPNSDILVVHRSDGSGTTFVWTDYLSAVSPEWRTKVGKGKEVKWPAGIGGKGNEGVAGQVKQTPGSVGYVELAYAKQNQLPYAHVRNSSGSFIEPNISTITAAADAAKIPANTDYRVSIVNSPGPQAYPVSAFTWLLIYRNQPDAAKAKKLKDFLRWAYTEGEASAAALDYARLPEAMTARLVTRLDSIGGGTTP